LPAVSSLRARQRTQTGSGPGRGFLGFGDPVLGDATAAASAPDASRSMEPPRFFRSVDGQGVALADPSTLRAQLAPLPGTRDELMAMAEALGTDASSLRLGNQATEAAVRRPDALADAGIVAFATHGLLPHEINGLDEPGLVFTPPAQATAGDDGILTASEASRLSLQADWLILSACNTAGADGRAGADSLSGLARAFLYAGARALLVSHWRVRDDVTSVLTVETLRLGRTQPGLTRAQALQEAMRSVRTGKRSDGSAVPGWTPDWAHPMAWAPFVVVSDQDR
jgi:CHAT domain-containing protein